MRTIEVGGGGVVALDEDKIDLVFAAGTDASSLGFCTSIIQTRAVLVFLRPTV